MANNHIDPRNQFNGRLSQRYWDIPTDIPRATPYNTPIGTHLCDRLGFICHPQRYPNIHGGNYPDTDNESDLYNLDYYNPLDVLCQQQQNLKPELIKQHYNGINRCQTTPQLWRNHSKLLKYNNLH